MLPKTCLRGVGCLGERDGVKLGFRKTRLVALLKTLSFLANFSNAARTDATRADASLWTAKSQVGSPRHAFERLRQRRRRQREPPFKRCHSADAKRAVRAPYQLPAGLKRTLGTL